MAEFPTTAGLTNVVIKEDGDVIRQITGNPIAAFLETKDLDFDRRQFLKYIDVITAEVTDAEQLENVDVNVGYRDTLGGTITWVGPFSLEELAEALFMRITARYVRIRIASDSVGVFWRLAALEVFGRFHGRRF
jgi:hypothetical protein